MSFRAPKRDKCHVCGKTVYDMEKMVADGVVFHKTCMKCTECGKTLGLGNYAALSGKYYCKPHFKQLFALKGNYSEGFGEEKPTAKWQEKDGSAKPSPAATAARTPDTLAPTPVNVVKSGGAVEDAASVVSAGSQSPSAARAKFQSLGASDGGEKKKSATNSPSSPFNVRREKCEVCGKTVYEMEKMAADGKVFHKTCMKCTECGKTLSLGNYAALSGKYYCKPHFKQLFQLKGNYSEGFGEELPTAKWQEKSSSADDVSPAAAEATAPAAEEAAAPVEEAAPAEEEAAPAEEEAAPAEEESAPAEEEAAPAEEEAVAE